MAIDNLNATCYLSKASGVFPVLRSFDSIIYVMVGAVTEE